MHLVDVLLIIIIGGFGLFGLWFGLFHTLGSLIGTLFGIYFSSRWYIPVAAWLMQTTGWSENVTTILAFSITFLVINRVIGLLFWTVQRFTSIITSLPFIASLNRIGGAIFGVAEGMISIGYILFFLEIYPLSERITPALSQSSVAPHTRALAERLLPLVPDALRLLQTGAESVEQVVK